jgi:hypothetical protein
MLIWKRLTVIAITIVVAQDSANSEGYRLKEARRTVQVRAIKGVAENQKSKCSVSDTRCGWNFLRRERKPQS